MNEVRVGRHRRRVTGTAKAEARGEATIRFETAADRSALWGTQDVYLGGDLVGKYRVSLHPEFVPDPDMAHIEWFEVRAGKRRMGYGRAIIERALFDLKSRGINRVTLDSTRGGYPFWLRMGFRPSYGTGAEAERFFREMPGGVVGVERDLE